MTLLGFTRLMENIAGNQPAVNTIVRDNVLKLNGNPSVKYGAFAWVQGQHSENLATGLRTLRFSVFYVDRLLLDKSNTTEVQSVGLDVLGNIIRTLAESCDIDDWTIDTFTQRFTDECAGAYATFSALVPATPCAEEYEPSNTPTI